MLEANIVDAKELMASAKYYESYGRWSDVLNRYETWDEAVERVINMHRTYYANKMTPELDELLKEVEQGYKDKLFLGSQRALQFGGEQLLKNHNRLYNCTMGYLDRAAAFGEIFHLMLSGCGVGFSVQYRHIDELPSIVERGSGRKSYVIEDSIEGWADSINVLLSSFFADGGVHKEYQGCKVDFDYSNIRPKGAHISGGFKAPGPDGLRKAHEEIETLLLKTLDNKKYRISPIIAYDIVMHTADAVISGGVRRAACVCLFSKEDTEMRNAKTGSWFVDNPQRGRSNNSVMLLRDSTTYEEFKEIIKSVKDYGEPGFVWTSDLDALFNPCVEINGYGYTEDGRSGFTFCNLTEINGAAAVDVDTFYKQCKLASIMGTLQAGYTDFKFVSKETKEITEREALLGVSITGWMNNPDILFDPVISETGAKEAVRWNRIVAKYIGINPAARVTTVKPAGSTSVLLGTASGIHGEHSKRYFRHTQFNTETEIAKLFMEQLPSMVERSVWGPNDIVIAFPVESIEGSIYKSDLLGTKQLDKVIAAQKHWINAGKDESLCVKPWLNHNVSNTITVDDWDVVGDYIYNNRYDLGGVSLLAASGDKAYAQAPFTEVFTFAEIVDKYGDPVLFTSGLIEAGLTAYNGDLWNAINTALGVGEKLGTSSEYLLKRDFVRRFRKFAHRFIDLGEHKDNSDFMDMFNRWDVTEKRILAIKDKLTNILTDSVSVTTNTLNEINNLTTELSTLIDESNILNAAMGGHAISTHLDTAMNKCADCLKDVYNYHKWTNVKRGIRNIDWSTALKTKKYVDVSTLGAQACTGGKCEI